MVSIGHPEGENKALCEELLTTLNVQSSDEIRSGKTKLLFFITRYFYLIPNSYRSSQNFVIFTCTLLHIFDNNSIIIKWLFVYEDHQNKTHKKYLFDRLKDTAAEDLENV